MLPLMSTRIAHAERRLVIGPERQDRLERAVVPHFEIGRREAAHDASAPVADRRLYRHDVRSAPKCRWRLSRRSLRAREHDAQPDQANRDGESTKHLLMSCVPAGHVQSTNRLGIASGCGRKLLGND